MRDHLATTAQGSYISLSAQSTLRAAPHSYPFTLLDRIKACYPEAGIGHAVKHITLSDPVLSGHFAGFPIYPGALIIEAMAQNACMTHSLRGLYQQLGSLDQLLELFRQPSGAMAVERRQYVLAETRVKNLAPVFPGCALDLEARLLTERDGMYVYKVCAQVDGIDVARGQLTMAAVPLSMVPGMLDRVGHHA